MSAGTAVLHAPDLLPRSGENVRYRYPVHQSEGTEIRVTVAGTVDYAGSDQLFDALVGVVATEGVRKVELGGKP